MKTWPFYAQIIMRIKKALLFKIIAIFLTLCLFVHGLGYAAPCLRVNSAFDGVNREDDQGRTIEFLNSTSTNEYSFADFLRSIKFSDFIEGIKSDTPGQLFGRSVALVFFLLGGATDYFNFSSICQAGVARPCLFHTREAWL